MNQSKHLSVKSCLCAFAAGLYLMLAAGSLRAQTLADLIEEGDHRDALQLIRQGVDVNESQPDGTTALHWAVHLVDYELAEALISAEADVNVVNNFGASPLSEAVRLGDSRLVEALLEAGADADYRNADKQTALMLAINTGDTEISRMLIEHGADVNVVEKVYGQTALMWAASSGREELVKLLVSHGADVNVRASVNDWPSQITAEPRAQYRSVAGMTTFLYGVRSGCIQCVETMLEAGADINEPSPEGVTPLMVAIDNNHWDMAQYLLDEGANPHVRDWWGRTALYCAVDMASGGSGTTSGPGRAFGDKAPKVAVIRRLLDMGVNVDPELNFHRPGRGGGSGRFVDDLLNTGATPLLRAAMAGDQELMGILLDYGADINMGNATGITPLLVVAGQGVTRMDQDAAIANIDYLLSRGADINAKIEDVTSLTARVARPSQMTDRGGHTIIYGPIKVGWAKVVRHLIDIGVPVDVEDHLGVSPLDASLGNIGGRDNVVSEEVADILREALEDGA